MCGGIMQSAVAVIRADGAGWTSRDLELGASSRHCGGPRRVDDEHRARGRHRVVPRVEPVGQRSDFNLRPGRRAAARRRSVRRQSQCRRCAVGHDRRSSGRGRLRSRRPAHRADARSGHAGRQRRSRCSSRAQAPRIRGISSFTCRRSGGLACASCHPEGREDGHVWKFADFGSRRTQSIGGGLLGTEPFHWSGDMTDFKTLAHDVFTSRMSGPALSERHSSALAELDRSNSGLATGTG